MKIIVLYTLTAYLAVLNSTQAQTFNVTRSITQVSESRTYLVAQFDINIQNDSGDIKLTDNSIERPFSFSVTRNGRYLAPGDGAGYYSHTSPMVISQSGAYSTGQDIIIRQGSIVHMVVHCAVSSKDSDTEFIPVGMYQVQLNGLRWSDDSGNLRTNVLNYSTSAIHFGEGSIKPPKIVTFKNGLFTARGAPEKTYTLMRSGDLINWVPSEKSITNNGGDLTVTGDMDDPIGFFKLRQND